MTIDSVPRILRVSSETVRTFVEVWKKSDCTAENVERSTSNAEFRFYLPANHANGREFGDGQNVN